MDNLIKSEKFIFQSSSPCSFLQTLVYVTNNYLMEIGVEFIPVNLQPIEQFWKRQNFESFVNMANSGK